MKRPNITPDDAEAIERKAPSIAIVDVTLGGGGPAAQTERVYYRQPADEAADQSSAPPSAGRTPSSSPSESGRFFTAGEVQRRQNVVVIGQTASRGAVPGRGSDRQGGAARPVPVHGHRRDGQAAEPGRVRHRRGRLRRSCRTRPIRSSSAFGANTVGRGEMRSVQIAAVPREGVPREQAMREVEEVMRIRHGLRLDEPNDFDIVTQDAILGVLGSDHARRRSSRSSCCRRSR